MLVIRRIGLVLALLASGVGLVVLPSSAANLVPPNNPHADDWAVPAYTYTPRNEGYTVPPCWRDAGSTVVPAAATTKCHNAELAATNRAERVEGLPSVHLPRNYNALNSAEQLFVLANIERVSRGEPPILGLSTLVNSYAQRGAATRSDPSLPEPTTVTGATGGYTANYAGAVSAIDANYEWMYTDGWDGKYTFNADCTSAAASGCWGHRDDILVDAAMLPCASTCSYVMGVGYVPRGSGADYNSYTELFVQVSGGAPTLYYTWSQATAAGARG